MERADVVVVGMGPGGEAVAGRLAQAGLDVVGVEAGLVGGECPYWGCVPSKAVVRAADLVAEAERGPEVAGAVDLRPDWEVVARRVRQLTAGWDDAEAVARFEGAGGRLVRGRGRLVGPDRVEVAGRVVQAARAVVVATGTAPVVPPVPGLAEARPWTNREAVAAAELPASLVVLGGGAVGAELAQALARFGVDVVVVERGPRLLGAEEPEAGEALGRAFAAEGIEVRCGAEVASVARRGGAVALALADGSVVGGDEVLVAAGRRADLAALGLGSAGVDPGLGSVPVDGRLRVLGGDGRPVPGLYAVGDVTGQGAFTHVAVRQGQVAADAVLGRPGPPFDATAVPRVTFTDPEVGAVGLTEAAAREAGLAVRVGRAEVAATSRGWIHGPGAEGVVKVVEDADRGVLVGALAMGPSGGEVLGLLSLAVQAGVPTDELRRALYAYPTFHRGIEEALADLS